jgi:hypothetical protein
MKINDTAKVILVVIGGLGLIYGFYIYLNPLHFVDKTDGMAFPIPLSIVVFIIWLAAILTLNQIGDLKKMDLKSRLNPVKLWGTMFKGTPKWVLLLAIAAFIFGVINAGSLFDSSGVTGMIDGKYVVHNHGQVIRELTEQEYLIEKSKELKGIAAAHIFFLGMGIGFLYPRKRFE